jgi:hypothetical protein
MEDLTFQREFKIYVEEIGEAVETQDRAMDVEIKMMTTVQQALLAGRPPLLPLETMESLFWELELEMELN